MSSRRYFKLFPNLDRFYFPISSFRLETPILVSGLILSRFKKPTTGGTVDNLFQ